MGASAACLTRCALSLRAIARARQMEELVKALLLVDIQNDFCEGGALAVAGADAIVPVANALLAKAKDAGLPTIATKDYHPSTHTSFASNNDGAVVGEVRTVGGLSQMMWPDHCVEGTCGAKFHPDLNAAAIDEVVYKGTNPKIDSYSGFFDNAKGEATGLSDVLRARGVDEVIICGLATDYCVRATAEDAISEGFKVSVVTDGVAAVDPSRKVSDHVLHELSEKGCICAPSSALLATI